MLIAEGSRKAARVLRRWGDSHLGRRDALPVEGPGLQRRHPRHPHEVMELRPRSEGRLKHSPSGALVRMEADGRAATTRRAAPWVGSHKAREPCVL